MLKLNPVRISGAEVLPLVEGGKGINITAGLGSGRWASCGGVGTFSCVNADSYDKDGNVILQTYEGIKDRFDRHKKLIEYGIAGGLAQAKIAYEEARNKGRVHMNVLWEMGGCPPILEGVLSGAKGLIHGVTCGAGMPYKLAEIASKYKVYYHPIISSARAFNALWKRSYSKFKDWLGSVVYEDPWLAGGHNGLSNSEDPLVPQDPYGRVVALRKTMNDFGLNDVPILMAGGVWCLNEWENYLDNPDVGPIAFQFGTRALLTQESPISEEWKQSIFDLKDGDVLLHKFSPTGFYSSAVKNKFLHELIDQSNRQLSFSPISEGELTKPFDVNGRGKIVYVSKEGQKNAATWRSKGFTSLMRTPDHTFMFVKPERAKQIQTDQVNCMGCLSMCQFSGWSQVKEIKGPKPDPRSFCIQKTLQDIAHGGKINDNLMFSGHNVFRFAKDPFYKDRFIPTVKQLVERLQTGQ